MLSPGRFGWGARLVGPADGDEQPFDQGYCEKQRNERPRGDEPMPAVALEMTSDDPQARQGNGRPRRDIAFANGTGSPQAGHAPRADFAGFFDICGGKAQEKRGGNIGSALTPISGGRDPVVERAAVDDSVGDAAAVEEQPLHLAAGERAGAEAAEDGDLVARLVDGAVAV
jgi:hypothetical protein